MLISCSISNKTYCGMIKQCSYAYNELETLDQISNKIGNLIIFFLQDRMHIQKISCLLMLYIGGATG